MPLERLAGTSEGKGAGETPDRRCVESALGRAAERIVLARLGVFLAAALAILVLLEAGCLWLVLGQSRVAVYAPESDAVRPFEGRGEAP